MIDLHAHVLPGLDDGPKSLDATLAVVEQARADGTTHIVSVAHANDHHFDVSREDYDGAMSSATRALESHGLPVTLVAGMEIRLGPDVVQGWREGRYLAVGDSPYLCIELPPNDFPEYTLDLLYQISLEGLRVYVIHPERNRGIRRRPELADRLLRMEILGVASAGSLLGQFGPEVEATSWRLMELGLIQSVASDGHSVEKRPLRLSPVRELLARRYGDEEADYMMDEVPKAVLAGQSVELAPRKRLGWRRYLWR